MRRLATRRNKEVFSMISKNRVATFHLEIRILFDYRLCIFVVERRSN